MKVGLSPLLPLVVSAALPACEGIIGAHGASPGSGPGPGTTGGLCQGAAAGADPGPAPLVKLSTVQYRNTVRDLLTASGLGTLMATVDPVLASVPEDSPLTFRGLDARISSDHLQAYFNLAVAVGNAVESDP